MNQKFCYQVNGGTCRNKVSAKNQFVCAAKHGRKEGSLVRKVEIIEIEQTTPSMTPSEAADTPLSSTAITPRPLSSMSIFDLEELAYDPSLGQEEQDQLVELGQKQGDNMILYALASNPSATLSTQRKILDTQLEDEIASLASNPNIDLSIQEVLMNHESKLVRMRLAKNGALTDVEKQRKLSEDLYLVQCNLGANPSLDASIAVKLTQQGHVPISGYAANKTIKELSTPSNLSLLREHPLAFSKSYLDRIVKCPIEPSEIETARALALYAYGLFKEHSDHHDAVVDYRSRILDVFEDDQEVAYLLDQ